MYEFTFGIFPDFLLPSLKASLYLRGSPGSFVTEAQMDAMLGRLDEATILVTLVLIGSDEAGSLEHKQTFDLGCKLARWGYGPLSKLLRKAEESATEVERVFKGFEGTMDVCYHFSSTFVEEEEL